MDTPKPSKTQWLLIKFPVEMAVIGYIWVCHFLGQIRIDGSHCL